MFTIRYQTTRYRPDLLITLRNNIDGWEHDLPGIYEHDGWRFELPITRYQPGMSFKFVLEKMYWMLGPDLTLTPADGATYVYSDAQVTFPPISELVVQNGYVQHLFFEPTFDEAHLFDVIVIGSGIGGGTVADQLSDMGLEVLVLEAGGYLFPAHVANLPRRHRIGRFDKHVWNLFEEFKVQNYVNDSTTRYDGGQAFNLGGRSLFWGGLIPRMSWWELDLWPRESLRWYLEDGGYQRAEDLLNRVPQPASPYHREIKRWLRSALPHFTHFDAPMAVQYTHDGSNTISTGMFSTADLLMESCMTAGPQGNQHLRINLNHAVVNLETAGDRVTQVVAHDLIANQLRSFRARYVILAAGTIESAKLALISRLRDPNGKIGVGLTDHPIFFTHFMLPPDAPLYHLSGSSKVLSQHHDAALNAHPYNIILELGADLNQGRYVDTDLFERHVREKNYHMLCEIVFLFNAPLMEENWLEQSGPSYIKPILHMQPSPAADPFWDEINAIKDQIIQQLGGIPLPQNDLSLKLAPPGGVAHEVGTLRIGTNGDGVVDTNLKFLGYENLFACDLSVFPSSPAANPTLTLVALAMRLADHIRRLV